MKAYKQVKGWKTDEYKSRKQIYGGANKEQIYGKPDEYMSRKQR